MDSQLKFFNKFFIGEFHPSKINTTYENAKVVSEISSSLMFPLTIEELLKQKCNLHKVESEEYFYKAPFEDMFGHYKDLLYLKQKCPEFSAKYKEFPGYLLEKLVNDLLSSIKNIRPLDLRKFKKTIENEKKTINPYKTNQKLVWNGTAIHFAESFHTHIRDNTIQVDGKTNLAETVRILYSVFDIKGDIRGKKGKNSKVKYNSLYTLFRKLNSENNLGKK